MNESELFRNIDNDTPLTVLGDSAYIAVLTQHLKELGYSIEPDQNRVVVITSIPIEKVRETYQVTADTIYRIDPGDLLQLLAEKLSTISQEPKPQSF